MQVDTETGTQRSCQQTATRGSSHQRERIQINLYASGRRAFVYHDVYAVVLHGWVQIFLHYGAQPVYFVDEKYIIGLQASKHSRQIPRLVEHRTGGDFKAYPKFIGNNIWKCSFSQSGRTVKQHMVQRLATQAGSFHKYAQIVHHLVLPAEILKIQRTESVLEITFSAGDGLLVAYIKIFLFHSRFLCFLQNN